MTHKKPAAFVPAIAAALLSAAVITLGQRPAPMPVSVLVTVHDAKGDAVSSLTRTDFRLEQDNEPQPITSFAAMHSGGASVLSAKSVSSALELSANTSLLSGAPDLNSKTKDGRLPIALGRNIALYFDDTHLTSQDLEQTKGAADQYLRSVAIEDRIAIVTASGSNETDFTTEHNKLQADLAKVAKTWCSPLAYWDAEAFDLTKVPDAVGSSLFSVLGSCDMVQMGAPLLYGAPNIGATIGFDTLGGAVSQKTADQLSDVLREENDLVTHAALNRFELLISRMSTLPGQRIIIFISPGFSYPNEDAELAGVIDLADRANVTINTIDAIALVDSSIGDLHKTDPLRVDPAAMAALGNIAKTGESRSEKVLTELADGTGGVFFNKGNDYRRAFRGIAEPPNSYYLLGYVPQNLARDGSYHKLRVTIATANYTIDARHGFFAPTGTLTSLDAAKAVMSEELFSTEDQYGLPVTFESQVTQPGPASKQITVRANFDISHLSLEEKDGINQENVNASAILFDQDGHYLSRIDQVDQTKLSDQQLADLSESGYYMKFAFDAKPGGYIARVVIQNLVDGRISSENLAVVVPKGKVPPLTPKQIAKQVEEDAYQAFRREPNPEQKIRLAEQFEQEYPDSTDLRDVRSSLVALYYDTGNSRKFYAAATQAIAKDPDDVPLLSLAGWVIPRLYDEKDPQFRSMLVQSEKYAKRALDLVASMKKPSAISDADFATVKENQSWQPHSGLGIAYFRQGNYADSASELQIAVSQEAAGPDQFDWYVLGLDLVKLNRHADAADAFARCSRAAGQLAAQCSRDAESLVTHASTARN